MNRDPYRAPRAGSTLVEVMLACVVLTLVVLAGSSFLCQSRASTSIQRNRRAAIEAATRRLEDLRATAYDRVKPAAEDYAIHYLRASGTNWVQSAADPHETNVVNGVAMAMTTTVLYMDAGGDGDSYDCLRLTVAAGYRQGAADRVMLETIYAP